MFLAEEAHKKSRSKDGESDINNVIGDQQRSEEPVRLIKKMLKLLGMVPLLLYQIVQAHPVK
jgi:hypothetical protein